VRPAADSLSRIPLQLAQGCVVASIQVDLDEGILAAFRDELLDFLQASGARGVILDLSGVDVMDGEDYRAIRDTMRMALLMGARTVLSGLNAGVVAALIDLGVDTRGVEATATLDDAFSVFGQEEGSGSEVSGPVIAGPEGSELPGEATPEDWAQAVVHDDDA
jgi:rsbT antagonist protein RsbS